MTNFKQYKRKEVAELQEISQEQIDFFKERGIFPSRNVGVFPSVNVIVSISDADLKNGSPKIGDMIARNPKNHNDQWLVAEKYFNDNFDIVL